MFIITLVTLAIIGPLLSQNHSPPSLLCFSFEKWLESQVTPQKMVHQISYELSASSPSESRHDSPVKGTDSKDSLQL